MQDKDNATLKEQIMRSMRAKETEELLQIWQENDRKQWSDFSIEIVGEILRERLGEVPTQGPPPAPVVKPAVAGEGRSKGFAWIWSLITLAGWGLALFIVFEFQAGEILEKIGNISSTRYIPDLLGVISGMIGVSLGITLGVLQSFGMRRWNIPQIAWILATAFGWGLPAFILPRLRNELLFDRLPISDGFVTYLEYEWIVFPALLFLTGAFIGWLQTFVFKERMTRKIFWTLANALGLLALGILVNEMLKVPVGVMTGPIDLFLDPQARSGLLTMPVRDMLLLIAALVPVMAAFLTGLPAGLILERYGQLPAKG